LAIKIGIKLRRGFFDEGNIDWGIDLLVEWEIRLGGIAQLVKF